jgi:hypothetical protein
MTLRSAIRSLKELELGLHRAKAALKRSGFSNFYEEQIISEHAARLLPGGGPRTAVDLGAGDGLKRSNTYALFREGWRGLGVESDAHLARKLKQAYKKFPDVVACHRKVTPENVVPLLREHGVEREFGVLSLDIDSYDYWVLDALLRSFRPRLVVTEINEKIPPPVEFVVNYDPDFRLTHHFFGYSIQSLERLARGHGYAILGLEYNNAFLAPAELPGVAGLDAETAYRRGYLERPDRREKFPFNYDMEALLSMSPAEAVQFLRRFFSRSEGKYQLRIGEGEMPDVRCRMSE